jgi:hypothetical protein
MKTRPAFSRSKLKIRIRIQPAFHWSKNEVLKVKTVLNDRHCITPI